MPERDPLDLLAEEYADRCRRGESPSISEYAKRHPELAQELRRLLPAVGFLEQAKAIQSPSATAAFLASAGSSGQESAPPLTSLGDSRIVRELGRGGMGIVYEAVQEPLGRRVAIKVLPRLALNDPRSRRRFLREAQVVAGFQHPHIVPVHTIGEQDGMLYFVMALIDGVGLDRLLADPSALSFRDGRERGRWVAGLGVQAAQALGYAHEHGVLHRDLKPANLLLDRSGTLWLADFGLAKLADDLSLTGTGELPGTLRYLPPECLHDAADTRSDLYSLGLTLYELAVGQPAFPESNRVRLIRQIEEHRVAAPRQHIPDLPRDLETILLKAIAREPSARYPSADDLADDLRRFLDGRPIRARRAHPIERLYRGCRRNPIVTVLAVTTLALALITGLLAYRSWNNPPVAQPPAPPEQPLPPPPSPNPPDPDLPPPPRPDAGPMRPFPKAGPRGPGPPGIRPDPPPFRGPTDPPRRRQGPGPGPRGSGFDRPGAGPMPPIRFIGAT
jgi:hypothetical protein